MTRKMTLLNPATENLPGSELETEAGDHSFSGNFLLPAGEPLALQSEIALQIPSLLGKSYREIRASFGVSGSNKNTDLNMTDDGMAMITMIGPVTRYDNWCSSLFGGVSVDSMMNQIQVALDDPSCKGICLMIDSPGGTAAGVHDLADMIFQGRDKKPIVAYVDNMAASAAYWVASACSGIVMSPAAFVGSIGVVTTIYTGSNEKEVELVSSKSPKKRPNVLEDEGRAQIQTRIDALADVFIGSVAKHRDVETSMVESDFGQGDMVIGSFAVEKGMADSVGNLDTALTELRRLQDRSINSERYSTIGGKSNMLKDKAAGTGDETPVVMTAADLLTEHPEAAQALIAQGRADGMTAGAAAEIERIKAISVLDTAQNRAVAGELIDAAKYDGKTDAKELAFEILKKQGEKIESTAADRKTDAAQIPAEKLAAAGVPTDTTGLKINGEEVDQETKSAADAIAAIANESRGKGAK